MIGLKPQPTERNNPVAHKIKTTPRPHINRDGTKSDSKIDYHVTHRHRKRKKLIGVFTSKKAAAEAELAEKVSTFGPQS